MTPRPGSILAVALQYDAPDAPRVTAVGRGVIGEKVIEAARAHGVPMRQNTALAEALAQVPLDDEIPEALYVAVAEIIGFLMRQGHAARGQTTKAAQEARAASS